MSLGGDELGVAATTKTSPWATRSGSGVAWLLTKATRLPSGLHSGISSAYALGPVRGPLVNLVSFLVEISKRKRCGFLSER